MSKEDFEFSEEYLQQSEFYPFPKLVVENIQPGPYTIVDPVGRWWSGEDKAGVHFEFYVMSVVGEDGQTYSAKLNKTSAINLVNAFGRTPSKWVKKQVVFKVDRRSSYVFFICEPFDQALV